MILVIGGTTEGRRAIKALEEAGNPYWYSTKTGEQEVTMHHGRRTDGAMNADEIDRFCRENEIKLIVDAAHPFARVLHQAIANVATVLGLPVVRFERIYPPRDPDITWIDDYCELPPLLPTPCTLLSTTGVQSIARLKPLENEGIRIFYRILDRESSIQLALRQGARREQLCYYEDAREIPVRADVLLLKESGESGGFTEKVEAARAQGMKIIALKRPPMPCASLPTSFTLSPSPLTEYVVDGEYGLRRTVEQLLPDFYPLKSGLTTGTCATAAAIAAMLQCIGARGKEQGARSRGQEECIRLEDKQSANVSSCPLPLAPCPFCLPDEVPVRLPNGETIFVPVHYGDGYAYCIKDGGDDPDVTNGIEVRATACPHTKEGGSPCDGALPLRLGLSGIEVYAGEGIGRFTLPGFDYPPGEAAVNRVPREMLRQNIKLLCDQLSTFRSARRDACLSKNFQFSIILSVPQGAEIARRTFNPRLGIEGGISLIGVSGIVMPYSEEAFVQSIRKCMEVAKAAFPPDTQMVNGTREVLGSSKNLVNSKCHVVIGSGMKSEQQLRRLYPDLPPQAFVEYGNYIGETLKMAHELNIPRVTLGIMIGKAVKLAQGHLDTHSRRVTMDKQFVAQLLREAHCPLSIIHSQLPRITVARELWDLLSPSEAQRLSEVIVRHCYEHCKPLLPNGQLTILLLRNE